MKQLTVSLPDNQVDVLAEKLTELVTGLGGKVTITNKDLFDTNIPIWERIETLEDAIAYTEMALPENIDEMPKDIQAYHKLRIITAAYNEQKGTELDQFPKFEKGEWRYWPWFTFYTQKEVDAMSEEEKSRVVLRSYSNSGSQGGVGFADCYLDSSHADAFYGSRLAFKTREAAIECGKRFIDLWLDYCYLPSKE